MLTDKETSGFYNEDIEIRRLMDEGVRLSVERDVRTLSVLGRLKETARERNDHALMGFAEYYEAGYHYDSADFDAFHEHLRLAVRELLHSDEYELLARAYNFFAVDAYSRGSFDVAYRYYMSALRFVGDLDNSAATGVILSNLADLFSRNGDYKLAGRYFKRGIRMVMADRDDPFYQRNMLAAYTNDGLNSLSMGDTDAAIKTFRKAEKIFKNADEAQLQDVRIAYEFFETAIRLSTGDEGYVKERIPEIAEKLSREKASYDFIEDIDDFCRTLIMRGQAKAAARIIEAVDRNVMESGVTHAKFIFAKLKAYCYETLGDRDRLTKTLYEMHPVYVAHMDEAKRVYKNSIDLVELIAELREEELRVIRENERLQEEAETDALTGIPNRYVMDRALSEAFERAYENRRRIGVCIMDVDDFKVYNDEYGHQTGDRCLVVIGEVLKEMSNDERIFCARYGGDEFLIIYEDMDDNEILKSARKIGSSIAARPIYMDNIPVRRRVTVSQGICNDIPSEKSRPWDYLARADAALYTLKENRKNARGGNAVSVNRLPDLYR